MDELMTSPALMMTLLGQYFQIRDDYQNLVAADVSSRWLEDIDPS